MQLTTGQAIVQSLLRQGVDTVFGMPGVQTYDLFDAFYDVEDKIRVVLVRHEQAAAYMAYGYARSTGKVGVFSVVLVENMVFVCCETSENESCACVDVSINGVIQFKEV